jgi:hypothetical protein
MAAKEVWETSYKSGCGRIAQQAEEENYMRKRTYR